LLRPAHGLQVATQIALGLHTAYNLAATVVSFPAGKLSDHLGQRGPGIGCAETAEHAAVAALAPDNLGGSAFGLLRTGWCQTWWAASCTSSAVWTSSIACQ
jgi:MFS family permease